MFRKHIQMFCMAILLHPCYGEGDEVISEVSLLSTRGKGEGSDFEISCLIGNNTNERMFFGELSIADSSIYDSNGKRLAIGGSGTLRSSRTFVLLEPNKSGIKGGWTTDTILREILPIELTKMLIRPDRDAKHVSTIKTTLRARYFPAGSSKSKLFEKRLIFSRQENGDFTLQVGTLESVNDPEGYMNQAGYQFPASSKFIGFSTRDSVWVKIVLDGQDADDFLKSGVHRADFEASSDSSRLEARDMAAALSMNESEKTNNWIPVNSLFKDGFVGPKIKTAPTKNLAVYQFGEETILIYVFHLR